MRLVEQRADGFAAGGPVTSRQEAEVTLPRDELDRIWSPEYLERLARTYWAWLSRISLGLLRVVYAADSRRVVLLAPPLTLLRFHPPEYETEPDRGAVTWRIDRGLLVAPPGRGKGHLRIEVSRPAGASGPEVTARVTAEVANFYPSLGGWGWSARLAAHFYRWTQMRIHVLVTNAFLRSLTRLELVPSKVGALRSKTGR